VARMRRLVKTMRLGAAPVMQMAGSPPPPVWASTTVTMAARTPAGMQRVQQKARSPLARLNREHEAKEVPGQTAGRSLPEEM